MTAQKSHRNRVPLGAKVGMIIASMAMVGCTAPRGGGDVQASDDGRPVTIKAMVLLNPSSKFVADKFIPKFEKEHPNIKVQWEMVPYAGGYVQKAQLALANNQAPFDIVMWWDQLLPTTQRFLEPLDPYIAKSNFDIDDFDPAWRDPATVSGKTYGIPWVADMWTFWYRKDLLGKAGVAVPRTTQELLDACRKLTDKDKKQYGYVLLGQRDPLQVMSWLPWLWSNGGEVFDPKWHPQINDSAAVQAGQYWKQLADCAPDGSENYKNTDAITAFASGSAAMGNMGIGWIGSVQQQAPDVAAKINFGGRIPGSGAANHLAHGWPLTIAKASSNKGAAWTFLSSLTSAESFKSVATDPGGSHVVMARKSVYNDAAVEKVHPWVKDVRQVVQYVRPKFNPGLGNPPGWSDVMDDIALGNSQILANEKTPEAAYKDAEGALDEQMRNLGLLK
jgi:multiple sugar transport system substrate-binding protein